jgi:hypothetical protein
MLRYQVVGQLESFMETRANDFHDAVMVSINETKRHPLTIKLHAWFRRTRMTFAADQGRPGARHRDAPRFPSEN